MNVSNILIVKLLLGVLTVGFVWFAVGDTISTDDTDQLLYCVAVGLGLATVVL